MKTGQTEKRVYSAPELTEYGQVREITRGQQVGQNLDRTFPTKTHIDDLTFTPHC